MRSRVDRAFALIPVAALAAAILTFYFVEAWLRKTPWVFTDEEEWTQISRAIAATGHAARRGQPIYFQSLYVYVIAPVWWIHSTASAYAALKYLNAVVMSLAAVPTYLLARYYVTTRTAVAVAVLAVLIPGHVVRRVDRNGSARVSGVCARLMADRQGSLSSAAPSLRACDRSLVRRRARACAAV